MAISVDWGSKIISVPKADMSLIQSTPVEIRELDVDTFRLTLKALEDDEEGMPFPDTHDHKTEIVIGGQTYARSVEIINDYTVTFEDGQYVVNLVGANNNIMDVLNANQVSVRGNNSAGLIVGTGILTDQDKDDIADAVWDELDTDHILTDSYGKLLADVETLLTFISDTEGGRWRIINNQMIFYKSDNNTEVMRFNLFDENGSPAETNIYERQRV